MRPNLNTYLVYKTRLFFSFLHPTQTLHAQLLYIDLAKEVYFATQQQQYWIVQMFRSALDSLNALNNCFCPPTIHRYAYLFICTCTLSAEGIKQSVPKVLIDFNFSSIIRFQISVQSVIYGTFTESTLHNCGKDKVPSVGHHMQFCEEILKRNFQWEKKYRYQISDRIDHQCFNHVGIQSIKDTAFISIYNSDLCSYQKTYPAIQGAFIQIAIPQIISPILCYFSCAYPACLCQHMLIWYSHF